MVLEHVRNVMAHAQKPDLVFQRNGRVHLNRSGRGGQFSRLLAAEVCASAVVTLDTPCSEVQCKTTGYPFHSHVSPSLPLPYVTVCHQVSTDLYIDCGSIVSLPFADLPSMETCELLSYSASHKLLDSKWSFRGGGEIHVNTNYD